MCAPGPEPMTDGERRLAADHGAERWPQYSLTTLVCTILDADVELTRAGVVRGWDRTETGGEDFWCRVVAAAAVKPSEERKGEEEKRRNAEENRLAVGEEETEEVERARGETRGYINQRG